MILELRIPDALKLDNHTEDYRAFLQAMLNRILVGELRYGPPNRRKRYMRRMRLEVRTYQQTGNFENLLNICNYAYLESEAPENKLLHFDPAAASATRDELGGAIA